MELVLTKSHEPLSKPHSSIIELLIKGSLKGNPILIKDERLRPRAPKNAKCPAGSGQTRGES